MTGVDPKPYLDYLDKEMTIMGILSAFSVAAPGGVLVTVMGKDGQVAIALWNSEPSFILAGSVLCVIAAGLFYKQRSDLAWFYGRLSFVQAHGSGEASEASIKYWLKEADAWTTWRPYLCAFLVLLSGFANYFLAATFFVTSTKCKWLAIHLHSAKLVTFIVVVSTAILGCALDCYVRTKYKHEERAWHKFWHSLKGKYRK